MRRAVWNNRILLLLLAGCAYSRGSVAPATYIPAFNYAPPVTAAPGSAGVRFAIVNPRFAPTNIALSGMEPFAGFSKSLSRDFQVLLAARGFTTRGPFPATEEMTYPDRQNSDLVLLPTIEVSLAIPDKQTHQQVNVIGPGTFTLSGTVAVGGRVTLALNESLSNERMWVRSIEVRRDPVSWTGSLAYNAQTSSPDAINATFLLQSDHAFANAVARELEQIYSQVLQTAWNYLDPSEMTVVKRQSLDVRARWVSTGH